MRTKYFLLVPFRGKVFQKNRIFYLNNGSNIFYGLKKYLGKKNIVINTIDQRINRNPDKIIICDMPYPWEIGYWLKLILNRKRSVLFCFESPIVNPFSHLSFFYKLFERVYTWNDLLANKNNTIKFFIPQVSTGLKVKKVKNSKKKFLVLINSKKSIPFLLKLLSPSRRELYSERERIISYFEKRKFESFHLFGRGWNKTDHPSYRGEIENKIELLSNYKFSICFENCIAEGYITEKIFDCFKAKCVPIYWGAPNIKKYISEKCFIDFRKFTNLDELLGYLTKMSDKEYNTYIDSIDKLLSSKKFLKEWFEDGFRERLTHDILE